VAAANLAARLPDPPDWLPGFAVHAAAGHCPARAAGLVGQLGRLLTDGGPTHPQALLERARRPGRSMGTLARTLQDFLVGSRLAVPLDQPARLAAGRRNRRLQGIPAALRSAVAGFTEANLRAQQRAHRAGTRPRADNTIERRLSILRDLACFLADRGRTDWAAVDVHDIEAFLRTQPANRKTRLTAVKQFFGWARGRRLLLVDPTAGLTAREPRGYRGRTLTLARQRELFRRWTSDPTIHPHEALVGLLALLHAAASQELRGLTVTDLDPADRTIRLGRRPQPTPLDPASWAALQRCLDHRDRLRTGNPHILVTKATKATLQPASQYYLSHVLDPARVAPRVLRGTRLVDLAANHDPKLVAEAVGMRPEGVLPYLADHVDTDRLPNL
jgi:site-specific recombinase XerD